MRHPGAALPCATRQGRSSWASWQHVVWRPARRCAPVGELGGTADKLPAKHPVLPPHSHCATRQLTLRAGWPAQPSAGCHGPRPGWETLPGVLMGSGGLQRPTSRP